MHHQYWFCFLSRFQLTGCGSYKVDINSFNICLKLWILVQNLLLFTPTVCLKIEQLSYLNCVLYHVFERELIFPCNANKVQVLLVLLSLDTFGNLSKTSLHLVYPNIMHKGRGWGGIKASQAYTIVIP